MKKIAIVVMLLFCLFIWPSSGFEVERVNVGVYPGGQEVWDYEEELDVNFSHVLRFQNVKMLNYSEVIEYLDLGYEVILNVEFMDNYANLDAVAEGVYDDYLVALAEEIKADGRTVWLRPLHEFNGNWYNWGVFYSGNEKEDFVPAWRHVVDLFRSLEAPVLFQLNYNRYNGRLDPTSFSELWPGDEWLDMVVITSYNRAYTDQWHQFWRTFTE
ncbi:hypothetical protein KAI12_05225, partial [Candidatus Bathyarchaeota archaeon]|nr:hypothetical protein [Candidatus Bathyarchaeota archaeon]